MLNGALLPEPHRTLLAAEAVFPSPDHFDQRDPFWDEYVAHRILNHLVLLFILSSHGRFLATIPNRSVESAKYLSEQEVENREKQNNDD
jgi:hypothetical protein